MVSHSLCFDHLHRGIHLSVPTVSHCSFLYLTDLFDCSLCWIRLNIPPFNSLNGTDKPLSVSLTSSLVDGGPVHVTVCVFSSLCQYYSVKERRWSSEGLQPLEGSTLHAAHCLTQHLTMFGASLFVHPGAVVLLPPVCENTKHYTYLYTFLLNIVTMKIYWNISLKSGEERS